MDTNFSHPAEGCVVAGTELSSITELGTKMAFHADIRWVYVLGGGGY